MNDAPQTKRLELGPVTRGEKAIKALQGLVEASHSIEEDGGSEKQQEAFSEAYQEACITLYELGAD